MHGAPQPVVQPTGMADPDAPVVMTKIAPFQPQPTTQKQIVKKQEDKPVVTPTKTVTPVVDVKPLAVQPPKKDTAKSEEKATDSKASSSASAEENTLIPYDHGKHDRGFKWVEPDRIEPVVDMTEGNGHITHGG